MRKRLLNAGVSMSLRGTALLAKFALLIYISRYIGLEALGIIGLIQAACVVGSKAIGCGFSYIANRAMVTAKPARQAAIIRDQQILYITVYIGVAVFTLLCAPLLPAEYRPYLGHFLILLILSHQIVEQVLMIVALHRQIAANMVFFFANGLWAFFIIAIGIADPAQRSVEAVLNAWIVGVFAAWLIGWFVLARLPLRKVWSARADWSWIRKSIRQAFPMYIAIVALALSVYIDRYILTLYEGVALAGVFIMFWSFGNAIQVLIQTGVMQHAGPRLIAHYGQNQERPFWKLFREMMLLVSVAGAVFCIAAAILIEPVLVIIERPLSSAHAHVFWIMLGAFWVRFLSDALNSALYARHRDRELVAANFSGLIVAIGSNILLVSQMGIYGAAVAQIVVAFYMLIIQGWLLWRVRHDRQRGKETPLPMMSS